MPACSGAINGGGGSGGDGNGNGGSGSGGDGTNGGGQPTACMGAAPTAPVLHARMLSPSQYNNTVEDLVKVAGNPAKDFANGADTQLDDLGAERRANAAAAVARQAVASLGAWAPCSPTAMPADACGKQIVDQVGTRAFRHPLTAVERGQLQTLFDAGVKEKDFATGVEWFLTGVLQSPDFLYQFARPAAGEQAGKIRPIAGYEMASRLSYFLWDSMPDDKLFEAAGNAGGLADSASIQDQLGRMLADQPRFLRGVRSFYSTWLAIDGFDELARDDKAFTTDLVHALGTSLLMSATQLYSSATPNISSLFSGQTYYLDSTLRAFYGVGGGGPDFTAVDIPGENRRGLLTHPALMAQLARPQKTHPINRGFFVRSKLLCQEMAPPPGVMIPALPEVPVMGVTTREEVAEHSRKPECSSCHTMLDPPGLALEGFDQVGRHREMENGKPVDTSGTMINSGDLDGPFAKGDDLLQKMGASKTVKSCFAQQYFEYAMTGDVARPVADTDKCSVDRLSGSFATSGDLKGLVQLIATSDSFRFRSSEGVGP